MRNDQIILRPIMTEKSTMLKDAYNKYTFVVHKSANKILIKDAIKSLFDVTPLKVNILNVRGKKKRVRYKYGYTASYKKAIITLKQGDKISIFEGA